MKKFENLVIAFVLVFALLFVTACGPAVIQEQIDRKTTLNTSGTYIEEGALESLNEVV